MYKRKIGECIIGMGFFIAACLIVGHGMDGTAARTEEEEKAQLELALSHAIVECYAIEGIYPPNIDYIEEHYGVVVNEKKYIVRYDIFEANIMPDYEVIERDWEDEK